MIQLENVKARYKMTELGEIPTEWEIDYIDNVASRYSGHTPDKKVDEYWNGNIPWISLKDTKRLDNRYIEQTEDYTTQNGINNSSAVLLPEDTVVLSRDATVGKVGITAKQMATSQHFINYVCGSRLNNLYLYYDFLNRKPLFERIGVGSTIKTIGLGFFKSLKIILPSINEQEKIAEILWTVDEQIEITNSLIEKIEKLKKGLMQRLLTKGIGHNKFKNTDVGIIPDAWVIKELSQISLLITKGTTPSTYGFEFIDEGINFIKIENISDNGKIDEKSLLKISEECNEKLSRSKVKEGDILVSIAGSLGKSVVIPLNILPANTNQALAIIRLDKTFYSVEYVNFIFASKLFKNYIEKISTVGAQPNLSLQQIGDFKIPIPELNEQKKIASMLSAIDGRIEQYIFTRDKLQKLKKGLMQKLLTGKIRVQ